MAYAVGMTWPANEAMNRIHRKFGFIDVKTIPAAYKTGEDGVLVMLQL